MSKKANGSHLSRARMVRSLIIVAAIAVFFGLFSKIAMEFVNRKMGLEPGESISEQPLPPEQDPMEIPEMPVLDPVETMETGLSVWAPDWEVTPCSVFVAGSEAIQDSLPEAPESSERATELQLLMELWAEHAGYMQTDIDRVWSFSRNDTCYIDLPSAPDWASVAMTIEGRFVSYTRLFPFVNGDPAGENDDGIPLRGIPFN